MSLRGLRSRMATIDVSNVHSKGNRDLDPPGYDAAFGVDDASTRRASTSGSNGGGAAHRAAKTTEETPEMFQRRTAALSSLSFSPLKQVAMTSFMMYMTGTNLHLFSILTVINGVYSPITTILRSGVMFQRPEGSKVDVLGPRIVYCTCHLAGLLFALYRVMLMGLIPLSVADYSGSIVGSRADGLVGVRTLF